jgi:NAD(P)-dependent dehydrogenase (short-subunit alcohol dehydrogenase family)
MHEDHPKESPNATQPIRDLATIKDIVDAVLYLVHADHVTGEILHVDGSGAVGR